MRLLYASPRSTSSVIPDSIRNPQNGKPKRHFELWILNQVQDDRLVQDDGLVHDDGLVQDDRLIQSDTRKK